MEVVLFHKKLVKGKNVQNAKPLTPSAPKGFRLENKTQTNRAMKEAHSSYVPGAIIDLIIIVVLCFSSPWRIIEIRRKCQTCKDIFMIDRAIREATL